MSDTKPTKAPTHEIIHLVGEGDQTRRMKIGVAWTHKDNKGENLVFNYWPLTPGVIMTRRIKAKDQAEG